MENKQPVKHQTNEVSVIEQLVGNEKALSKVFDAYHKKFTSIARPDISGDRYQRLKQLTIMEISANEKLKPCFESNYGKLSILKLIENCLRYNLELGKHAYAVPQSRKVGNDWIKEARFDIKAIGYKAILCGGPQPVLDDLEWFPVYSKDADRIIMNEATGELSIPVNICPDRGEIIGVIVKATPRITEKTYRNPIPKLKFIDKKP